MQLYLRKNITEHRFEEIKKLLTEQISNTILQILPSAQRYYNHTMVQTK